jgi:hypothetical protein
MYSVVRLEIAIGRKQKMESAGGRGNDMSKILIVQSRSSKQETHPRVEDHGRPDHRIRKFIQGSHVLYEERKGYIPILGT